MESENMGVPQYHPGKVIDTYQAGEKGVVSAGTGMQAMLRMWDGHTLIVNVDHVLKSKIRPGDIVLVDYYPSEKFSNPIPKIVVSRILRGEKARLAVEEYKAYYKRMRTAKHEGPAENGQAHERYIG